jgi:hypothetical protein
MHIVSGSKITIRGNTLKGVGENLTRSLEDGRNLGMVCSL